MEEEEGGATAEDPSAASGETESRGQVEAIRIRDLVVEDIARDQNIEEEEEAETEIPSAMEQEDNEFLGTRYRIGTKVNSILF